MSYNSVLDELFSFNVLGYSWLSYCRILAALPIILALGYMFGLIIWANTPVKRKNGKQKATHQETSERFDSKSSRKSSKKGSLIIFSFFVYLIAIILLETWINPTYWGYGHSEGINNIHLVEGNLYVEDYSHQYISKGSGATEFNRIHILNPESGEKKVRLIKEFKANLETVHGDSILITKVKDNKVSYYSIVDGHKFVEYTAKTIPTLFPELSAEIDNVSIQNSGEIMHITTTDGKQWDLKTASGILIRQNSGENNSKQTVTNSNHLDALNLKNLDAKSTGTMKTTDSELSNKDGINKFNVNPNQASSSFNLVLNASDGSNLTKLYNRSNSAVLNDMDFIGGKIIAVDEKDNLFIILHYQTTKKESFILTCMTFDGKQKLWEMKQSEISPETISSKKEKVKLNFKYDYQPGRLFFNNGIEIVALDMKVGKVVWKQKL